MVRKRGILDWIAHGILLLGVLVVGFPLYVTLIASTQSLPEIQQAPMSMLPGTHAVENYTRALTQGSSIGSTAPVARMMWISLTTAMIIAVGKIAISLLSAFAVVYFRFPEIGR